ncbi:MAG TPA: AIR carboxylase family protein [Candidatus Nanoarchaeia archaeon]|nr:AIR carboxylase family protein [Candidatus Nanoarchaeia archaeon]
MVHHGDRAVIIAGSGSDEGHLDDLVNALNKYGVPYDVRICSAHKQPEDCIHLMNDLNAEESRLVVIAVAGGTDALSGMLAWGLYHPVISCPPDGFENRSPLHNPPGSSNATIYHPENAARFVAQCYASDNSDIRTRFRKIKEKKCEGLRASDEAMRARYGSPRESA